jgi:hypothetical protein
MNANELIEIAKREGLVLWMGGSIEKMVVTGEHQVVSYDANKQDDPPGTLPRQGYSLLDTYFCVEVDETIFKSRTEVQTVLREWHKDHAQAGLLNDVKAFAASFARAYYLEHERCKKMGKDANDPQFKSHLAIRCWEILISGYRVE